MGLCFSKKQQQKRRDGQPSTDARKSGGRKSGRDTVLVADARKAPQARAPAPPSKKAVARPEEPAADKRTVFVVKAAAAAAAAEVAAAGNGGPHEAEAKRAAPEEEQEARPVAVGRVPVRTSSCTKEEVDAILIQCGRLSRSSSASGKAPSGERGGGGGNRRYAGSKRSYDFDHERRGRGDVDECDWSREGAAVTRPSPRRRTPERKRSSSHDGRTGGGSGSRSRRISRSPGRRADAVPAAAGSSGAGTGGERGGARQQQQPGKMVSVPAREKGRAPSPVKAAAAAASGKRYPSPRSSSPARAANENAGAAHAPSLSRSSSRKAEQSPFRRNPMAELDENALGNNHHHGTGKPLKKSGDGAVALPQKAAERASRTGKEKEIVVEESVVASDTNTSKAAAPARPMNATHFVSIVAESVSNPRPGSRSSRRSSRDFEHSGGNSYASLLLEDIQNYHQQSTSAATTATATAAPTFALPACVSKACSILEAVADLNSSSSENNNNKRSFELDRSPVNDKESVNGGRYGSKGGSGTLVLESEVGVKDDLVEPSMHKYVSVRDVRGETEPQESAGSNSFAGNAWTCSSWEPNSVDSTDRTRTTASQSYDNGDEVEEQSWQSKQRPASSQEPGHRGSSTSNVQAQRVRGAHRVSGSGSAVIGQADVRGVSASSSMA